LTDRIGHVFSDPELRRRALTHRSAGAKNNERLEFLGDALVNLFAAEALYARWPRADEGALTRARAQIVREESLAELARQLELGDQLELGPGELKSGGFRRDSILADAFEAIVGAIYLDAGFDVCRTRVLQWFEPHLIAMPDGAPEKDPKTRLQEWLQGRGFALPEYRLLRAEGDDHDKTFHVACITLDPPADAVGDGSSRRQAEQRAALAVLSTLSGTR
jgi:ribonuclease-3